MKNGIVVAGLAGVVLLAAIFVWRSNKDTNIVQKNNASVTRAEQSSAPNITEPERSAQLELETKIEPIATEQTSFPIPTAASETSEKRTNVNKTSRGIMRENETWRGEHRVTGDIRVPRGITLTIEPGARILVASHSDADNLFYFPFFDLKKGVNMTQDYDQYIHRGEPYRDEGNHISIRIDGELRAIGTPDNNITITSDSSNPTRYDWNVFNLESGTMEYVVMEYYRAFGPGNGAVVKHSTFRHVGECAICANSSARIENNEAYDTGHEIVDMHNSSPTIRNNRLGPAPLKSGIIIDGGSPVISGNHIF